MTDLGSLAGAVDLLPVEKNRTAILAAPLRVGPGTHVVLELFDKPAFTDDDRKHVAAAADIGAELLRQALAERQTHQLLFDAVEAALRASQNVTDTLNDAGPPAAVLEQLKAGLAADANAVADPDATLRLVAAVRALAVTHGPAAVDHCTRMAESLHALLSESAG
jgi:two-component system, NtrC family, nitrogen regulation response regulator NtrX